MNRNEFENRMKDKMQEQQFSPGEDLWIKLQADLQRPADSKRQALIFLPWVKIAAAVTLILSSGIGVTYFLSDRDPREANLIAVQRPPASDPLKPGSHTDTQQAATLTQDPHNKMYATPHNGAPLRPTQRTQAPGRPGPEAVQVAQVPEQHTPAANTQQQERTQPAANSQHN